eukprot:781817_1
MSFTMLRIPRNCINFRHLMLFGFVLMFAFGDFGEATTSINPVVDTYTAEDLEYRMLFFLSVRPEVMAREIRNYYVNLINKHRSVNGVSEIYFDENENTRLDHILRSTECTTDVTDPLYFDYLSDPVIALDNIAQPFGMGVAIHNEPNKKYHWHVKFTDPISCKIKDE